MSTKLNEDNFELQNKLNDAAAMAVNLLSPNSVVTKLLRDFAGGYRNRIYTPSVTVWMFIGQILSKDHGCQQAVNRFNVYRVAHGLAKVSSNTKAYCKARSRLPEELFTRLLDWTAKRCSETGSGAWLFHNRVVEVVDGWTLTMADTAENQNAYPQLKNQKRGCGFPIARMIGVFSLSTGAIRSYAISCYEGKQTGETSLLRSILHQFSRGQILLADRYYAGFWMMAQSELNGIDLVARVHHLRKVDFRRGLKIGQLDQLVAYQRPTRPSWMSKEIYDECPGFILVRHLKYKVRQKGFRTREITLATTLLDAEIYPAEELAELYRRRWEVELHIRSIKTQMQMEHLRCKTPQMVRKEICCHFIGYNLVRASMIASALKLRWEPTRLSFVNAMQALEEFAASLRLRPGRLQAQWDNLLATIGKCVVGNRPGRQEERVLKRRMKKYKLMQKPRDSTRNRYATSV